jgi:hypothetical protein
MAFATTATVSAWGTIIKFSRKGVLFKTNEGVAQLVGVMEKNEWVFSVTDPAVVEKLRIAQQTGRPAVLQYAERKWVMPWQGSTHYFVTDVKVTQ